MVRDTIDTGNKIEAGGKHGTQYIKDYKRPIGTEGETTVKVVVKDGSIRTAYPIAEAVVGVIGSLLNPFDAISGELANGELPDHLRYPENDPCE